MRRVVTRSISDLGEQQWRRLAVGASFYQSYHWLRWAERHGGYATKYHAFISPDGELEAAVPEYVWGGQEVIGAAAYSPLKLLVEPRLGPTLAEHHRRWNRLALLGSCAGYHGGVLLRAGLDGPRRRKLVKSLLGSARSLTDGTARPMAVMYVPSHEVREYPRSWGAISAQASAEVVADLQGTHISQHLEALPSRRRQLWRREMRAFQNGGSEIFLSRLSDTCEEVAPLLGHLQRKYGADVSDEEMYDYLRTQARHLDPYSIVITERRNRLTTGFVLLYEWEDTLYARVAGFLPQAGPFAYFNLLFYEATRIALERGLSRLNVGTGTYQAKVLRGARMESLSVITYPPEGASDGMLEALSCNSEEYTEAVAAAALQIDLAGSSHAPVQSP